MSGRTIALYYLIFPIGSEVISIMSLVLSGRHWFLTVLNFKDALEGRELTHKCLLWGVSILFDLTSLGHGWLGQNGYLTQKEANNKLNSSSYFALGLVTLLDYYKQKIQIEKEEIINQRWEENILFYCMGNGKMLFIFPSKFPVLMSSCISCSSISVPLYPNNRGYL